MNNGNFYLADAIDVIQEVLDGGGEFRLYPRGVSMLPLIRQERDSVVLKKRADLSEAPVRKHEIAFYRRESGQFVLHRVMRAEKDGTYTMCGDNQLDLERGIRREQIIGYVAGIYRKDKPLPMNGLSYRTYTLFWNCMPLRHCIKFPKRALGWIKRRLNKKA